LPSKPETNGQLEMDTGDAHEGPATAEADFDPAKYEMPTPDAKPNPFNDVASFRLTDDFHASVGVKKALVVVPVRTPDKAWFVRVHPDEAYRLQTAVLDLKEEREVYLIDPKLRSELATEPTLKPKLLATAINRQGDLFLWAVNLPRSDGRADRWSQTALEAVNRATKGWIRVAANLSGGHYDVWHASDQLSPPEWPEISFSEILRLAFKERYIYGLDHPVLRKLRGEV
jgi:hypothetical protein